MTFKESVPIGLYNDIIKHLAEICQKKAISSWKSNRKKEDSITGAFFGGISIDKVKYILGNSQWEWSIEYNSFSSADEEPDLGADGLFHIVVEDEITGKTFRKGFLFQSKRDYNVFKKKTSDQLKDIEAHVKNSSLLITYSDGFYGALEGETFLDSPESWKRNNENLCQFLIKKFLACKYGVNNLYYDFEKGVIMNNGKKVLIEAKGAGGIKVKKKKR